MIAAFPFVVATVGAEVALKVLEFHRVTWDDRFRTSTKTWR